jgi:hypothetical protein
MSIPDNVRTRERVDAIADWVTESGTTGIWAWRKWASGIKECWGKVPFSNSTCNTAWGNVYVSPAITVPNYPFTFSELPVVTEGVQASLTYAYWLTTLSNPLPSVTNPGGFYITRGSSGGSGIAAGVITIYAIGT